MRYTGIILLVIIDYTNMESFNASYIEYTVFFFFFLFFKKIIEIEIKLY